MSVSLEFVELSNPDNILAHVYSSVVPRNDEIVNIIDNDCKNLMELKVINVEYMFTRNNGPDDMAQIIIWCKKIN